MTSQLYKPLLKKRLSLIGEVARRRGDSLKQKLAIISNLIIPGIVRGKEYQSQRELADKVISEFSTESDLEFQGTVLIDAQWDNPNHWIRYALLRSALGLARSREIGILGEFRNEWCTRTLKSFGIQEIINCSSWDPNGQNLYQEAQTILEGTKSAEDILQWQLPENLPAALVYDGFLKKQKSGYVRHEDPQLIKYLIQVLTYIYRAKQIITSYPFDLLVVSHINHYRYSPLVWMALQRKIPVIRIHENYGVAGFVKLATPSDIFQGINRIQMADYQQLSVKQINQLAGIGQSYLKMRRAGKTDDIAAIFAYQKKNEFVDRRKLLDAFSWDQEKPVIGIYASRWFDFPHNLGMANFRDFWDWIQTTIDVVFKNQGVNWLFKDHPTNEWVQGAALKEIVPSGDTCQHLQVVPNDWSSAAVMDCLDGLITYHGTAGIECAALGKPVLVADKGWNHDIGFVKWARSREEYLQALGTQWWKELDLQKTTKLAQVFAGLHFGKPSWQNSFVLEFDSVQDEIYKKVPSLFSPENEPAIAQEIATIREWFYSDSCHYHTYKMSHAESFTP